MNERIIKYPRTPHIQGSRLGEGDEDLSQIPFSKILGRRIAIEEKVDGANTAISFGNDGALLLQSRGHFLTGGGRERQYNLLKIWANSHYDELYKILGQRYIMYGEWLYAKHAIYYDNLPHYFLEFDIFDKERAVFLDTENRRKMLDGSIVHSAPTLAVGIFSRKEEILAHLGNSAYISEQHIENLKNEAISLGLNGDEEIKLTPPTQQMEGIYIKCEEGGIVTERMKFVRRDFRQIQLLEGEGSHYKPIIKNKLCNGADNLYG